MKHKTPKRDNTNVVLEYIHEQIDAGELADIIEMPYYKLIEYLHRLGIPVYNTPLHDNCYCATATVDDDTNDKRESKFSIGQVVKHKTAGTRGVVVTHHETCTVHANGNFEDVFAHMNNKECVYEFNGMVTLSLSMTSTVDVDESLLTVVDDDYPP